MPHFLFILTLGVACAITPIARATAEPANVTLNAAPKSAVSADAQMDLLRWKEADFHKDMTKQVQALGEAFGKQRAVVLLDISELYLSKMLLAEAGLIANNLDPERLPTAQRRRRAQIVAAIGILLGKPGKPKQRSSLLDTPRPDREIWSVVDAIAMGNSKQLVENLRGAFVNRQRVPRDMLRNILPPMLEAMIETGKYDLARRGLRVLASFPEYQNAPIVDFLLGRIAERQGKSKTAFDYFYNASSGWDRYAARARLRLADMAIKNASPDALLAATRLLENGIQAWRGDRYELMTLERLALVNSMNGELFKALLVNGRIITRFGHTDVGKRALVLARAQLKKLYAEGASGKIDLSDWMKMNNRLVPIFRKLPEFAGYLEILADKVLALGATDYAISEYNRVLTLLGQQAGGPDAPDHSADIVRIQLKKASALIRSGQFDAAQKLLLHVPHPTDPTLGKQRADLELKIHSYFQDSNAVLEGTKNVISAKYLRARAYAFWEKREWIKAVNNYNLLWKKFPKVFDIEDAAYLLLSAQRSDEPMMATAVVQVFPELTDSKFLNWIGKQLLLKPADISHLGSAAANSRILSATETIKALNSQ